MSTVSTIFIIAFVAGTLIWLVWENHRVGKAVEDADEKAADAKRRFSIWGSILAVLLSGF